MKHSITYLLFFFLTLIPFTCLYGQLELDLGPDTTYCVSDDKMVLGEEMIITNAIGNIDFTWECKYEIAPGLFYTASMFLDDSTRQYPTTTGWISNKWFKYVLTITDEMNNSTSDSIMVRHSEFFYFPASINIEIIQGDSVELFFNVIDGGIEPLDYYWEPRKWVSNPDTLVTWCKPDSSIDYYLRAVDSIGCLSNSAIAHRIVVTPTGINTSSSDQPFKQFGSVIIFSEREYAEKSIVIYDLNGRINSKLKTHESIVDLGLLTDQQGIIFATIMIENKNYFIKYLQQ